MSNLVLTPLQKKHLASLPPTAKNAYLLDIHRKYQLKQKKQHQKSNKDGSLLTKLVVNQENKICKNIYCDKIITTSRASFCDKCTKKKEQGFSIVENFSKTSNIKKSKVSSHNSHPSNTLKKHSKQKLSSSTSSKSKCLPTLNITYEDYLQYSISSDSDSQGIIERFNTESSIQLVSQFDCLCKLFPEFPLPMLRMLYVREEGNSKFIFKYLKKQGWLDNINRDKILINKLHNTKAIYFNTLYYWGKYNRTALPHIEKTVGNYYTAYNNIENEFILVYINTLSQLQTYKITSPAVSLEIIDKFSLQNPIHRPKDLLHYSLVPFF